MTREQVPWSHKTNTLQDPASEAPVRLSIKPVRDVNSIMTELSRLVRRLKSIRDLGRHVDDPLEKCLDHLVAMLLAGLLDLFLLGLSFLIGILFGLFVAARVLSPSAAASAQTRSSAGSIYRGLKLLVLFFSLFPILLYLFLCLAPGIFDPFRAI